MKGVVFQPGRVILLKNERQEWELPGGKLEAGETPEACVAREIEEELGMPAEVGRLLDVWVYHIFAGADVLIVTFGCTVPESAPIVLSHEYSQVGMFTPDELSCLNMPTAYKVSIAHWVDVC